MCAARRSGIGGTFMSTINTEPEKPVSPDLEGLHQLAQLLDNQFRIPGTQWRFGLDGIIGLVPYLGDIAGLLVSGFLLRTMLQKGAGPVLMLRMMGNYVVDALIGIVPFVGDLFDFGFKANRRNVAMLQRYYADGAARPSATRSAGLLALMFFLLFVAMLYGTWRLAAWGIEMLGSIKF